MSRHRSYRSRAFSYDDDYEDDYYDDDYYEEQQHQPQGTSQLSSFVDNSAPTAQQGLDDEVVAELVTYVRDQLSTDAAFVPPDDRIAEILSHYDYDPDRALQSFRAARQQQAAPKKTPTAAQSKQQAQQKQAKGQASPAKKSAGKPPTPKKGGHASSKSIGSSKPELAAAKSPAPTEETEDTEDAVSVDGCEDIDTSAHINEKPSLSTVVVGHVDAGKSTLMGQLLLQLGVVDMHQVRKYQRAAQGKGKGSFYLAWIMDEGEEEREHGVTIDVATRSFDTANRHIKILDAPGHKDFIPNMIDGASSADVSILVVPAAPNEYETAMGERAQTREHAILLRSLGIEQIIVAVNKIDNTNPPYDQERFNAIQADVGGFLESIGFERPYIQFIPVSAYNGDNVATLDAACPLASWYHGPTLVQGIDSFRDPQEIATARSVQRSTPEQLPPRAMITEVLKVTDRTVEVMVRVIRGRLRVNRKYCIYPMKRVAKVSSIEIEGMMVDTAAERTESKVVLRYPLKKTSADSNSIPTGCVLAKGPPFPRVSNIFYAIITCVPNMARPLMPGYYDLHIHGARVECAIRLRETVDIHTRSRIRKSPQFVGANESARVKIETRDPITIEDFDDCAALGRFVLRDEGRTVAVGMVHKHKARQA